MQLRLTPREIGNVCLLLIISMFYYVPIVMPNVESFATVQTQIDQSHGVAHVVLVLLWIGILFFVSTARFHLRFDLFAAKAAYAFCALAFLAALWSTRPASAISAGFGTTMSTTYAIYLVSRYPTERLLAMLSWTLMLLAVGSAVFAIALPQYGVDHFSNAGAWQGVFGQKNSLGVVMVLAIAVGLSLKAENLPHRIWKYTLIAFAILDAALSGSREAWLIASLMIALFAALRAFSRLAIESRNLAFVISGVAAALTGLTVVLARSSVLKLLGRDATLRGRTAVWSEALGIWRHHALLGIGLGPFWGTPAATHLNLVVGWIPTSSHNGYIEAMLDLGIVGVSFLLAIFAVAYLSMLKVLKKYPNYDMVQVWILCIFVVTLFNFVQTSTMPPGYLSWLLLVGGACVLEEHARSEIVVLEPVSAEEALVVAS